jgi:hypothetical protein
LRKYLKELKNCVEKYGLNKYSSFLEEIFKNLSVKWKKIFLEFFPELQKEFKNTDEFYIIVEKIS